jgi:hypothetical protein
VCRKKYLVLPEASAYRRASHVLLGCSIQLDFHAYQIDHPDLAYVYKDYSGKRVVTLGHGEIIVLEPVSSNQSLVLSTELVAATTMLFWPSRCAVWILVRCAMAHRRTTTTCAPSADLVRTLLRNAPISTRSLVLSTELVAATTMLFWPSRCAVWIAFE